MKTVDAKCPGVISLITEKSNDNYLARRDFVDTFNTMRITLLKESMKAKEQSWNPILHAGLLFFRELDIKGYKLETELNRTIKTGMNLLEDEVLAAVTLKAMNVLCETKLSDEELNMLGTKISSKIPTILANETIIVDQDENIIKRDVNSRDCFYNLLLLKDWYQGLDLNNFFFNEMIDLDKNDPRYQELLTIQSIMQDNNAKNISMNGNSNVIISSYQDIHDRFKAYKQLKEKQYSISQLNRGNGITMVKMYR